LTRLLSAAGERVAKAQFFQMIGKIKGRPADTPVVLEIVEQDLADSQDQKDFLSKEGRYLVRFRPQYCKGGGLCQKRAKGRDL